jgi:hypothetical protein
MSACADKVTAANKIANSLFTVSLLV